MVRKPKQYDAEVIQRVAWMLKRGLTLKQIRGGGLDRPMPRFGWWVLLQQVKVKNDSSVPKDGRGEAKTLPVQPSQEDSLG